LQFSLSLAPLSGFLRPSEIWEHIYVSVLGMATRTEREKEAEQRQAGIEALRKTEARRLRRQLVGDIYAQALSTWLP